MPVFAEPLDALGPVVAAWDFADSTRERLVLYQVGPAGARQLADTRVPAAAREAEVDQLVARGVRIGGCYGPTFFVWVADERGFGVWTNEAQTVEGSSRSPDITRVQVFVDETDAGHRGVQFVRSTGGNILVAEERSKLPGLDPTYDNTDLERDTMWAHFLGLHLALWHDVPLENEIEPLSIANDLAVARALRELATALEAAPATGVFPELVRSLAPMGRSPELTLIVRPELLDDAARLVDIGVKSASGKTVSSQTIRRGTSAAIVGFLRRVTSPRTVLFAMNGILSEQDAREGR